MSKIPNPCDKPVVCIDDFEVCDIPNQNIYFETEIEDYKLGDFPYPSLIFASKRNGACFSGLWTNSRDCCYDNSPQSMCGFKLVGRFDAATGLPVLPPVITDFICPNSIAVGNTATFSAVASDPAGNPLSYSWSFGDGKSGQGQVATHTYLSPGNYNIILIVSNGAATVQRTCSTVISDGSPIAILSMSCPIGDIALGNSANFAVVTSGGSGVLSYLWNFGDGSPSVSTAVPNATHTYTSIGAYGATVVVTDQSNNNNDTFTCPVSVTNPGVSNVSVDTIVCNTEGLPGQVQTFSAIVSGGIAPLTYTFDWDDGTPNTVQSSHVANHIFALDGNYDVVISATDGITTDSAGCTITIGSAPLVITNLTCPTAQLTTGIAFNVSVAAQGGVPVYLYTWAWGDGTPNTVTAGLTANHTYTSDGQKTITVTVEDNGSNSVFQSCNVQVGTPTAFIANMTCPGSAIPGTPFSINLTATGAVGPVSYSVLFGDGTPAVVVTGSPSASAVHTYTGTQAYMVSVVATNGTATSNDNCTINSASLSLSQTCPPSGTIALGVPASFSASLTGGINTPTYTWDFDDGGAATGASVNHTFTSNAIRLVQVTAYDGPIGSPNFEQQSCTIQVGQFTVNAVCPVSPPFETGDNLSFTAEVDGEPNGGLVTTVWVWGDGSPDSTFTGTGTGSGVDIIANHTYTSANSYLPSVTAYDGNITSLITATDDCSLEVVDPPAMTATLSISPPVQTQNTSLSIMAEVLNASGGSANYTIDWNDFTTDTGTMFNGTPITVAHTYTTPGIFLVSLVVDDGVNPVANPQQRVGIESSGGTLGVTITDPITCPISIPSGNPFTYMSSVTNPAGALTYYWIWNDGTPMGNMQDETHTFSSIGTYVVLIVVDDTVSFKADYCEVTVT